MLRSFRRIARRSCWPLVGSLLLLACSRQESSDAQSTQTSKLSPQATDSKAAGASQASGSGDNTVAAPPTPNPVAPAPAAANQASEELRIGLAIPSYVHAVAWIAQDAGQFAAEGLKTDVTVTGGSAAAMRTLLGGSIDVALAGGDAVLKANHAGADIVVVGSLVNRYYHRLVARQEIQQPQDLKGKTIGLPFLGGPQDMAVQYGLNKWSLKYTQDVKVASLGKQFNLLAALTKNEIQATTSDAPDSVLNELGFHTLLDLPKEPAAFPYLVVATERKTLTQRRSTLARLLRALCAATDYYKQARSTAGAQRQVVFKTLETKLRGKKSKALQERFEQFGPDLLQLPPTIDQTGFEQVLELAKSVPQASLPESLPSKMFDAQLLNDAGGPCVPPSPPETP